VEMFDEIRTVRVVGEQYVGDEATLAETEFAAACDVLVKAERKFERIDAVPMHCCCIQWWNSSDHGSTFGDPGEPSTG
jgi:hypothetical protein